jgi:hypothetical protein
MSPRLSQRRTIASAAVLAFAAAIAAVSLVSAQGGDSAPADKPPPPPMTATPTAAVPDRVLTPAEARAKYLSGSLLDLDSALQAGDAERVLALWQRSDFTCNVGSARTSAVCEGQPGEVGSEHQVPVVLFEVRDEHRTVPQADAILRAVVGGNPADLVMVAKEAGNGRFLLGYQLRNPVVGYLQPGDAAYLYLEADPTAAEPLVILAITGPAQTPIAALGYGSFGGSFGGLLGADPQMLQDELQPKPIVTVGP